MLRSLRVTIFSSSSSVFVQKWISIESACFWMSQQTHKQTHGRTNSCTECSLMLCFLFMFRTLGCCKCYEIIKILAPGKIRSSTLVFVQDVLVYYTTSALMRLSTNRYMYLRWGFRVRCVRSNSIGGVKVPAPFIVPVRQRLQVRTPSSPRFLLNGDCGHFSTIMRICILQGSPPSQVELCHDFISIRS